MPPARSSFPGQISTHAHIGAHEGPRLLIDAGRREFPPLRLPALPARAPRGRPGLPHSAGLRAPRCATASRRCVRHGVTTVLAFAPAGPRRRRDHDGDGRGIRPPPRLGADRRRADAIGSMTTAPSRARSTRRSAIRHWRQAGVSSNDTAAPMTAAVRASSSSTNTTSRRRRSGARRSALARSLGVPFSMHFVEQHREFFETMATTGKTPVRAARRRGRARLRHHPGALRSTSPGHSLVGYPMADDIGAARTGRRRQVAHSPVAFSRRGVALESFDRYRRAGIDVALATDTYPLDMFSEMRTASIMGKVADRNYEAAAAGDVFAASNLAGAKALGRARSRTHRGRREGGPRDRRSTARSRSVPIPTRSARSCTLATPENVDTVIVDGRILVEGGRLADGGRGRDPRRGRRVEREGVGRPRGL